MTKVTIYTDQNNECVAFNVNGHAGYAEEGEDIVCAGISILTINTINSIEAFTEAEFTLDSDEESGMIDFKITKSTDESTLLLEALLLGLETMAENYSEYIDLKFREV